MTRAALAGLWLAAGALGCGAAPAQKPEQPGQIAAIPPGAAGRIEVKRFDARPRLALVSRDGDPAPAVVAVVATDVGPAATTALAAIVEARLRAAGFEIEARVDRSAFRVRAAIPDAARAGALFAAMSAAFAKPVTKGSPEIALAAQRLSSLRRNPLDAAEIAPIAACTGALGVAPGEALPDLGSDAAIAELEGARRAALHVGRTSIAAVGPAPYCAAVARALEAPGDWPAGAPADDPWPAADSIGVYTAPGLDRRGGRVTIAVRVPDPYAAAAAAERLGALDSPLAARLHALPEPWRVVEVAGVARPRGGCVSASIEIAGHPAGVPVEPPAAIAAALLREEMIAEVARGGGPLTAGVQILSAADPAEAAARAAWWALAGQAPGSPPRWAIALGLPPVDRQGHDGKPSDASLARFRGDLERSAAASGPVAERRASVERGQGELWLLLASPCGVAEEGASDAGFAAIAMLAAASAHRRLDGVIVEPWITSDGIGVIGHAAPRDDRETAAELARRVADAAGRVLAATLAPADAVAGARSLVLDHLERTAGRQGAAYEILAGALAPDHPSWVEPFGVWTRVAGAPPEAVRARGQALAAGPLRVAVIANADAAQAAAASDAVDRWLTPSPGPRVCRAPAPAAPRPGRYDVRAPSDGSLAQGLVGAPVPAPGAAGRELAEITALALDGADGLLASALAQAAATATARLAGGARAPSLVIDVRAPEGAVGPAIVEVKALLARLPSSASEADLARAASLAERRDLAARADPRRRLVDLWSDRKPSPAQRPALAAWRSFLAGALKDASLVVVEPRGE